MIGQASRFRHAFGSAGRSSRAVSPSFERTRYWGAVMGAEWLGGKLFRKINPWWRSGRKAKINTKKMK